MSQHTVYNVCDVTFVEKVQPETLVVPEQNNLDRLSYPTDMNKLNAILMFFYFEYLGPPLIGKKSCNARKSDFWSAVLNGLKIINTFCKHFVCNNY